jgi:hypothetical protein
MRTQEAADAIGIADLLRRQQNLFLRKKYWVMWGHMTQRYRLLMGLLTGNTR